MMFHRSKALAAAAIAAGIFSAAGVAHADVVLKSGDTMDGWKVTFPAGITLSASSTGATDAFTLQKGATFDSTEGLDITFTQIDATARPMITFDTEQVTNNSGTPWSGFQFLLQNTLAGNSPAATFASADDTFKTITPFTTTTFSNDTVTLGGGTLANGATATWGAGTDGGDLVINANPAATGTKVLDFKESPIAGTGIPVPAAGWTGLTGLVGLGLLSVRRNFRKMFA